MFPSRRRFPLSPYLEKATAEHPRHLPEHQVRATAVPQHPDRARRGRHANSAVTGARHGGSALSRLPESAQAFLTQSGHRKRGQGILLRQRSLPARRRVLTRAGPKAAAMPLGGQSDLLSSDSRYVEYLRFFLWPEALTPLRNTTGQGSLELLPWNARCCHLRGRHTTGIRCHTDRPL